MQQPPQPQRLLVLLLLVGVRLVSATSTSAAPNAAATDIPWDDLRAALGANTRLVTPTLESWKEQCVDPFFLPPLPAFAAIAGSAISNWNLMDQPDGTCMSQLSCIYDNCQLPTYNNPFPLSPVQTNPYVITDAFYFSLDFLAQDPDRFRLPQRVVHPTAAADVVEAVQFAALHNINLSVKVGGHSTMASSTSQGLLIKMRPDYPQYAIQGSGLVECDPTAIPTLVPASTDSSLFANPDDWVCALALARGKQAYLRVGGGEVGDEAYRAVSFDWNQNRTFEDGNSGRLYHLTSVGAGTVSVAGGWLGSGGLSGFTGTRLFGMGIDQILQYEMVLPDGQHVRFGPTEWSYTAAQQQQQQQQQLLYPQTTKVSGFCNRQPLERNEDLWEWVPCEAPAVGGVTFDDLWFAVRGGGGGTWGVVTSAYYQLHDFPGNFQQVQVAGIQYVPQLGIPILTGIRNTGFLRVFVEFMLRFLYRPQDLGVTLQQSNQCSSSNTASLTANGSWLCYNGTGYVLEQKWQDFVIMRTPQLRRAGFLPKEINAMQEIITVLDFDSFADFYTTPSELTEGIPEGRLYDRPRASVVPLISSFPDYVDTKHTLFPLSVFQGSEETFMTMVHLMVDEFNASPGPQVFIYTLGGLMPQASDGRDALSPTRRQTAFMKSVPNDSFRNRYYALFFRDADPTVDDFPGSLCHNHAQLQELGPILTDWTQACPDEWSFERRQAECISFQDAAWGAANVRELQRIKTALDPTNFFSCPGGIGTTPEPLEFTFSLNNLLFGFTAPIVIYLFFNSCTVSVM